MPRGMLGYMNAMKIVKTAVPGLAGAWAATWITSNKMYTDIPAGPDGDSKRKVYKYGAAGVAAVVVAYVLHSVGGKSA